MAEQPSEEKTLAASKKKLRDARQMGQVPRSRDLISGASLLGGSIYFVVSFASVRDRLLKFVDGVAAAETLPFGVAWQNASELAGATLYAAIVPLFAIVSACVLVAGVIGTLGPVFAIETLKPDFNRLSPATGLKRIFSLRNFIEFVTSLVKIKHHRQSAILTSCQAPAPPMGMTRSPTLMSSTSAPRSSTIPTPSNPGTNGSAVRLR
jgi:type III secretion protein U